MVIHPILIVSVFVFFIFCLIIAWKVAGNFSLFFAPRGTGPSRNTGSPVSEVLNHLDDALDIIKQIINKEHSND